MQLIILQPIHTLNLSIQSVLKKCFQAIYSTPFRNSVILAISDFYYKKPGFFRPSLRFSKILATWLATTLGSNQKLFATLRSSQYFAYILAKFCSFETNLDLKKLFTSFLLLQLSLQEHWSLHSWSRILQGHLVPFFSGHENPSAITWQEHVLAETKEKTHLFLHIHVMA